MRKGTKIQLIIISTMFMCLAVSLSLFADEKNLEKDMSVQVMLGATHFQNLSLTLKNTNNPTNEVNTDFSWVPLIGVAGQLPLKRNGSDIGIEGGAEIGWKSGSVNAVSGSTGTVYVHVDNDLYLGDIFFGPYFSTIYREKIRLYGGAGGILMGGRYHGDTNDMPTDGSQSYYKHSVSSAFGPGAYARFGIEYRLPDKSWLGLGVRGLAARMDFDNVNGTTTVKGAQIMLTYTVSP